MHAQRDHTRRLDEYEDVLEHCHDCGEIATCRQYGSNLCERCRRDRERAIREIDNVTSRWTRYEKARNARKR